MNFTVNEISKITNSKIVGDPNFVVTGLAFIKDAKEGDMVIAGNEKYFKEAIQTNASVILTKEVYAESNKILLLSENPDIDFVKLLEKIYKPNIFNKRENTIGENCQIPQSVQIALNATIGPNTVIGENTIIHAGVYIGANCKIGANCEIYPNVVIYDRTIIGNHVIIHGNTTIGADGFGYEPCPIGLLKVPQTGFVEISDEVEIGANTCIDRAKVGKTFIGYGSKIDNLCQIAHNVYIGKFTIVCGQTGIAGSSIVGDMCLIGAQTGVADHVEISNKCIVGAKTGVSKKYPEGSVIMGNPCHKVEEARRIEAIKNMLPQTHVEFRQMKKRLEAVVAELKDIQKKI